jgi:hypothetical protein
MLPLIAANVILGGILWYISIQDKKNLDKERLYGDHPNNPQYDEDLRNLWLADAIQKVKTNFFLDQENDKGEDEAIKSRYRAFIDRDPGTIRPDDEDLDEERELIQALNPEDELWCNGFKLEPCNPEDFAFFRAKIVTKAYQEQEYDGLPLDDGGLDRLYLDWFKMKGASQDGAEILFYRMGLKPWEWNEGCDFEGVQLR